MMITKDDINLYKAYTEDQHDHLFVKAYFNNNVELIKCLINDVQIKKTACLYTFMIECMSDPIIENAFNLFEARDLASSKLIQNKKPKGP